MVRISRSCSAHITCVSSSSLRMVPAVVGSIVVVGALTRCALLPSVYDLKASHMNVQCCLIQELTLKEFELSYNSAVAIKKHLLCERLITQLITLQLPGSYLSYQSRSGWAKNVDSEAVLGEHQSSPLDKKHPQLLNCVPRYQDIETLLTHPTHWSLGIMKKTTDKHINNIPG